jgi:hypothetical protein
MKNGKRIVIGARPPANPHADAWVRQGEGADIGKTDLYTARLTLDVTPALRASIKIAAFTRGLTVAEMPLKRVSLAARRDLHTGGCVLPRALGVQRLRHDTLTAHGAAGVYAAR